MHIQYFENAVDERNHPLLIHEDKVYFYTDHPNYLAFYEMDCRFPNRWSLINDFCREDVQYAYPAMSPDAKFLYVLFLRINAGECVFAMRRRTMATKKEEEFRFSGDRRQMLNINFEHIQIRAGENGKLVLYDRTVVRGSLPFWNIRFVPIDEKNCEMLVEHQPIGPGEAAVEQNGCLFTIAVDPLNGVFAKLMDPRTMLVYTRDTNQWIPYTLPPQTTLVNVFGTDGFPVEENRSVHETFGSHGHRVGAMQTRLTFHDSCGSVVARMLHVNKKNTTALVEFDHVSRHILVRKLATFNLRDDVSRMFYLAATPEIHVFMGVQQNAIAYVRSPTLAELAGVKVMEQLRKNGVATYYISSFSQLLLNAYQKYFPDLKIDKTKIKFR